MTQRTAARPDNQLSFTDQLLFLGQRATGQELAKLLLDLTDGVGFDVVIEASGAAHAPAAATVGVRRGGRVLLVGLHAAPRELDLTAMIVREVDIFTSVAHICDTDIPAALQLLSESNVAAVTAGPRIPLEELVEDGLRPLAEGRATGKILIAPGADGNHPEVEPRTMAGTT